MYAHCQQEGADGQRKYHYPHIELSAWVQLWAQGRADTAKQHCSYLANNPQTCRLASCNKSTLHVVDPALVGSASGGRDWQPAALKQAQQVVDEAHVVGVTGAYTASLCLALLRGPTQLSWRALAERGCHCDGSPLEGSPGAAAHRTTGRSLGSSHTHGTHTSVIGIDGATRDRIRSLTWMDELLYARALARLEKDLEVLGWECLLAR